MPPIRESADRLLLAAGLVAGAALGTDLLLARMHRELPPVRPGRTVRAERTNAPSLEAVANAARIQDPRDRLAAVRALMDRWARLSPEGATRACLSISDDCQEPALAAVFGAFGESSAQILSAVRLLTAADPARARIYAYAAVRALVKSPNPEAAARFALSAPIAYRNDLVNETFFRWAKLAPEEASLYALRDEPGSERPIAIESAFSGWASADPAGLAEAAAHFPDGSDRERALTKAFRSWTISDSRAAEAWLGLHPEAANAAERALRRD